MITTPNYIIYNKLPYRLSQLVIIIGITVFAGWIFKVPLLKSILPDYVVMNPNSALMLIVCGLAVTFEQNVTKQYYSRVINIMSLFIIGIATIRLVGFYPKWDIGIDQLLFNKQLAGNRMAPNTVINFLCVGGSIFFLNQRKENCYLLSQLLALIALAIGMLAIIGYLYADRSLYRVAAYIPMALHTAISFVILAFALLFSSSRYGLMEVVMHKNMGGKISRVLLPTTWGIPILLGWLRLEGQQRGYYNLEFGTALMVISIITVFTVFIWRLALSINKADTKRKKAEENMLVAKLEAEEAKKVQELFLANMSHEIRTPINGIIGMVQLIDTTSLSLEQREYSDIIKESASNLLVIINDILDVSKMRVGKIQLEKVNYSLQGMVKNLMTIFKLRTDEKGIGLNADIAEHIPSFLSGDPVRLNQILNNLLSNAIKFTEKGEVHLQITTLEENAESITLQFAVKDSGIGIPADKKDSVFESFTQASENTTRKYGGTGLGLTICKQLIELQGGKLSVISEVDKGSTFSFYIPINKIKEGKPDEIIVTPAKNYDMNDLNILLAEDNLINQKVASILLTKKGANVDIANNGSEVLDLLEKKEYCVILMDVNMPVLDGFETTKIIRKKETPYQSVPIIALTASVFASEREKCLNAGMDDYLSKPFNAEELYEKISHFANGFD